MIRVGVNYTPSHDWFHSWLDLDRYQVSSDLEAIAKLGVDHIRLFPLWPILQPSRTLIRQRGIDDVLAVVHAAGEQGLDVYVDGLNGHLASFEFLPSWVTGWHRANLFTDPLVVDGEEQLLRALGTELADCPNALGLSLGNEFAQFTAVRHPTPSVASSTEIGIWLGRLLGAVSQVWPSGQHSHNSDDDIWFADDHPFLPRHAVEKGAVTTVHSWVFTSAGQRLGPGHPGLARFARYLLELAAAWSPDPNRRLWLQEVGAPSNYIAPNDAATFLQCTLATASTMPGLQAMTWWCSHDVASSLSDFPALEYSLGLFDSHGRRKPAADALAEVVSDLRGAQPSPADRPSIEFTASWADGVGRESTRPGGTVFDQWLAADLGGQPARLVRHEPIAK